MKEDYAVLILLGHISALTVAIPFFVALFRRRKLDAPDRTLWLLMSISAITEIIIEILRSYDINNMYVTHVYTILEFVLISLFFARAIKPSKLIYAILAVALVFLYISGYELFHDPEDTSDEISTTTEAIVFIIYSLSTFYYMLQHPGQSSVFSIPLFWFNTGILLYFSGNLFIFLFSNYLQAHSQQVYSELWGIHSVLNIVFYILISIGFWKTKER